MGKSAAYKLPVKVIAIRIEKVNCRKCWSLATIICRNREFDEAFCDEHFREHVKGTPNDEG